MSLIRRVARPMLAATFVVGGLDQLRHPAKQAAKLAPRARMSATVLAATLAPTTYVGHPFWQAQDAATRAQQRTAFLKNLGVLGGLLLATVDTEGRPGVAYRMHMVSRGAERKAKTTRRQAKHAARAARREARLAARTAHDALT